MSPGEYRLVSSYALREIMPPDDRIEHPVASIIRRTQYFLASVEL